MPEESQEQEEEFDPSEFEMDEPEEEAAPAAPQFKAPTPLHKIGLEHEDPEAEPVTAGEHPETQLNAIGLKAAHTGSLFQVVKGASALYADASSPDYLEPQKHEESYQAAWKWAAKTRALRHEADKKVAAGAAAAHEDASQQQQLHEVSAKQTPCPWYGCPDGSHANFLPASVLKAKQQQLKLKQQQLKQKLHLAHGYGTTNAYTAKPLNAPENQYFAGDHTFHGSERPVTSQAGTVNGKEAYSNDMQPAYDLDGPTSFDSVPLAEPTSFLSRVAKDQPQGDGKLEYNEYRFTVLSSWRKYEHGLSKCMQAEATLDPSLKDYSCMDVQVGIKYLKDCMEHHSFGLQSLDQTATEQPLPWQAFPQESSSSSAKSEGGAWGVLPSLIQQSYSLDPEDYHTVYKVLSSSAVFTALWRMENLHIRCIYTGSTHVPEEVSRANQIRGIDREIYNIDRSLKHDYPGTPSMRIAEARLQGAFRGMPWEHNAITRGAVRNYWAHVASTT